MAACLPDNEAERLAVLREHHILDTAPEEEFNDLVRLAAHVCGVPIAAVSLIDEHRQWFKAITGIDATETPRDAAFCAHTILQPDPLVVEDATKDARFAHNPLVTGAPSIRFYVGMPLVTESGHALGSLCVIDRRPRRLSPMQKETLRLLARQVASHLRSVRRVAEQEHLVAEQQGLVAERECLVADKERLVLEKESLILEKERLASEREHAEEERALSEGRFRVLFEQSSDAHLLFDEDGIIDCNAATLTMMRCTDKAQLLGAHSALLSPESQPDGRRSGEKEPEMCALAWRNGGHRFEWQRRALDGYEYPVEVTLTPVKLGNRPALLSVWHDLSERKQAEERIRVHAVVLEFQKRELEKANAELAALATTDGLTGLKNHRAFQERLAEESRRAARYGTPLSLILLDVDHFKQFNDSYGHPAGDAVLRAVARLLRDRARETDTVARYGGEEFVLILPQTDCRGAATFAERLRSSVERHPWPVRAVTASFGAATLRPGDGGGADLIARADTALYRSKAAGRNRVACAPGPNAPAEALLGRTVS